MKKILSGSAVPRHLVFVLGDGSFVVQWNESYVQDLLTGRSRPFSEHDFGHHISDYELSQLRAAGRVEHFNRNYIWLFALEEQNRFIPEPRVQERMRDRVRGYYLNTTLPASELEQVRAAIAAAGLAGEYHAANRSDLVAVFSRSGTPFLSLKNAEHAQHLLQLKAPSIFKDSVIAFVDLPARNGGYKTMTTATSELLDLSSIIAAQTDTTLTVGKQAIIACSDEREYEPTAKLLQSMQMKVRTATNGQAVLMLLEDLHPSLLVMDMRIGEIHAWQMLSKIREIGLLRRVLTVIVAESGTSEADQSLGLGIAKVDVVAVKPLSMARLRHDIWLAFNRQVAEDNR